MRRVFNPRSLASRNRGQLGLRALVLGDLGSDHVSVVKICTVEAVWIPLGFSSLLE